MYFYSGLKKYIYIQILRYYSKDSYYNTLLHYMVILKKSSSIPALLLTLNVCLLSSAHIHPPSFPPSHTYTLLAFSDSRQSYPPIQNLPSLLSDTTFPSPHLLHNDTLYLTHCLLLSQSFFLSFLLLFFPSSRKKRTQGTQS